MKKDESNSDFCITLDHFDKDNLCLLYHHEIPINVYEVEEWDEKITEFIHRYERRHDRLRRLIRDNQKLCFIYYVRPRTIEFHYEDCTLFKEVVTRINKDILYTLVLLIDEDSETVYAKTSTYLKINIRYFFDIHLAAEWTTDQYDWKGILRYIRQHENVMNQIEEKQSIPHIDNS